MAALEQRNDNTRKPVALTTALRGTTAEILQILSAAEITNYELLESLQELGSDIAWLTSLTGAG